MSPIYKKIFLAVGSILGAILLNISIAFGAGADQLDQPEVEFSKARLKIDQVLQQIQSTIEVPQSLSSNTVKHSINQNLAHAKQQFEAGAYLSVIRDLRLAQARTQIVD